MNVEQRPAAALPRPLPSMAYVVPSATAAGMVTDMLMAKAATLSAVMRFISSRRVSGWQGRIPLDPLLITITVIETLADLHGRVA